MTQEVPEEGREAGLEIGDFQEAQEVIMSAPDPAHMAKEALTAAQGIIEARDTGRMKKEAVRIAVQERMTADTGQEGIALATEDRAHTEEGINCV